MSKQRSAKNEKIRKGTTADVSDYFNIKLTDSLLAGYTITYCENNVTFSIRHFLTSLALFSISIKVTRLTSTNRTVRAHHYNIVLKLQM